MKIIDARRHRHQPGPQLRHAQDHHRRRAGRARRRDPQRSRARRRELPARPSRPAAARPRPAPHRGHLAVPLPRRLLAARPGHDGGHRRGGHGALGHQGQGGGPAALPAARRRQPDRRPGLRARQRPRPAGSVRLDRRTPALGYQAVRVQTGHPGRWAASTASHEPARHATTTSPPASGAAGRGAWDTAAYLRHMPHVFEAVRNASGRPAAVARRAPPADPHGGRPSSARSSSPTTCSGSRTSPRPRTRRRCAWCASTRPRRSPSARCSTRSATTSRSSTEQLIDYVRSAVTHAGGITPMLQAVLDYAAVYQIKIRHPRADRHLAGGHGRRPAPGPGHPQLRHPGVHGTQRRPPTRCSGMATPSTTAACTRARSRASVSSSTRSRRRPPLRPRIPAGEPPQRRDRPRLVTDDVLRPGAV